jgi:predicted dehydrogenase
LGLVGCGAWGRNYIETIKSIPSATLAIICDPASMGVSFSVHHETTFATDYHGIENWIDKVIIATPPSTHREIATHFLRAGIPVLLEKPVAETLRDAEFIFNIAQQCNTTILIDNIHLFAPAYIGLRAIVSNWKRPFNIESFGLNYGPFREYSSLLDYGPHDLSMCLGITGSYPNSVKITKEKKNPGEIYNLELDFAEIHATVKIGNGHNHKERKFSVIGDDGYVTYVIHNGSEPILKSNFVELPVNASPPLSEVVRSFISSDTDWRYDPELNLNIMKVLSSY